MPAPVFKVVAPSTLWGFQLQQSRLDASYVPQKTAAAANTAGDPVVIYPKTRGPGKAGVLLWQKLRKGKKRKAET